MMQRPSEPTEMRLITVRHQHALGKPPEEVDNVYYDPLAETVRARRARRRARGLRHQAEVSDDEEESTGDEEFVPVGTEVQAARITGGGHYGDTTLTWGHGQTYGEDADTVKRRLRTEFLVPAIDQDDMDSAVDWLPDKAVLKLRRGARISDMLMNRQQVMMRWPRRPIQQHRSINLTLRAKAPFARLSDLLNQFRTANFAPVVVEMKFESFVDQMSGMAPLQSGGYHVVPQTIDLVGGSTTGLPWGFCVSLESKVPRSSQYNNWVQQNTVSSNRGAFQTITLPENSVMGADQTQRVYVGYYELLCRPAWCRWAPVDYTDALRNLHPDSTGHFYIFDVPSEKLTQTPSLVLHELLRGWSIYYDEILDAVRGHGAGDLQPGQVVVRRSDGGVTLNIPRTWLDNHLRKHEAITDAPRHMMSLDSVRVCFTPDSPNGWADFDKYFKDSRAMGPIMSDPPITLAALFHVNAAVSVLCNSNPMSPLS
jgi:hypothetical protein